MRFCVAVGAYLVLLPASEIVIYSTHCTFRYGIQLGDTFLRKGDVETAKNFFGEGMMLTVCIHPSSSLVFSSSFDASSCLVIVGPSKRISSAESLLWSS